MRILDGAISALDAGATTILVSKHIDQMLKSGQLDKISSKLSATLESLEHFDSTKYEFV